jgi:hypothetical protein
VGLWVYLVVLLFVGLVVGGLARLLLPGPDPMGIGMTDLVGLRDTSAPGCFRGMCCIATARVSSCRFCPRYWWGGSTAARAAGRTGAELRAACSRA